jgi:hypothetical protein
MFESGWQDRGSVQISHLLQTRSALLNHVLYLIR